MYFEYLTFRILFMFSMIIHTQVFFLFVTELVRVYQADRVSLFDHVVQVVLRRLEVVN